MTTKKALGKQATAKKSAAKRNDKEVPASMPKGGRDPRGGLTAKGREYFNKKEGSHLRPGVQGPADTPEKMVRKGSFLRRHFANPRGPMKDDKGEPTRLALSAHAWGEPVPDTMDDAKKLADEGHELLEQYHAIKDGAEAAPPGRSASGKKAATKKTAARKPPATESAAKKISARDANAAKKGTAKKTAAKSAGRKNAASQTPAPRSAAKKGAAKSTSARGSRG